MAEILAAIAIATESTSVCVKAISALKRFTRDTKTADQDLHDILSCVQRSRNLLDILRAGLIKIKDSDLADFDNVVSVDGFNQTIDEILDLAKTIAQGEAQISIVRRMTWSLRRSHSLRLVERLKAHENDLVQMANMINFVAGVRTQSGLEELIRDAQNRARIEGAFPSSPTLVDVESIAGEATAIRTWVGYVDSDNSYITDDYRRLRNQLADAAKFGRWNDLLEILKCAKDQFGESWVNAVRMKPGTQVASFWTPLHQAVYMSAPPDVVERLIHLGASLTMRTHWTEFEHLDVTALELAYSLEEPALQGLLCPVIRTPVPHDIIVKLQHNFHDLIRNEIQYLPGEHILYLPLIEPLTELVSEAVWFPIWCERPHVGYWYRLDGRDLLVQSRNVVGMDRIYTYRMTDEYIFDVGENAVVTVDDNKVVP